MSWDRKEYTWTTAEFSAALKKLGIDFHPNSEAVHVVFGNGNVKLKWAEPIEEESVGNDGGDQQSERQRRSNSEGQNQGSLLETSPESTDEADDASAD